MKLNTRLLIYLVTSLLAVIALQASLLGFFLNNLQESTQLQRAAESTKDETHEIELALLKQWFSLKNLFLRGHDPSAYYLHLEEFFSSEREVYASLEIIEASLVDDQALKKSFQGLKQIISSGSQDYRAAIDAYTDTSINPHIVADRYTSIENLIRAETDQFLALITAYENKEIEALNLVLEKAVMLLIASSIGGALVIFALMVLFFKRRFIRPLESAIDTATEITNGNIDLRIETTKDNKRKHEFDIFAQAFNEMLDALDSKNKELEQAISQLATAEKLSSLGSLVAGIAHELNTPIGVALTGSSCLSDRSDEIQKAMEKGTITKPQLELYLDEVRIGSNLIIDNIQVASELIQNFKQVAVDQSSERQREFNLRVTIEEVLSTLSPTLKKTNHIINLDIPNVIMMNSFPGPLGQVITNLINNSLIHGFEGISEGRININAVKHENSIELCYKDNGKGMTEEIQKRIFEPFFTTRLGQGGSGLGMHIVHNIVTGMLKGRLELTSEINSGVEIRMHLPLHAHTPSHTHSFTH